MKKWRIGIVLLLAFVSVLVTACGDKKEVPPEEAPTVYEVGLDKTALSLDEGQSDTLVATALADGEVVENPTLTWASSDETVATVEGGVVTAVKEGTANITVTYEGQTAAAVVTVVHVEPAVSLSYASLALTAGESETLSVIVSGNIAPASYTWTSDKPEIATVDGGVVTAVKAGTAVITVSTTVDGETYSDTCTVTVSDKIELAASLTGGGDGDDFFEGESYPLSVTVKRNDEVVTDVPYTVAVSPSSAATYNDGTKTVDIADGAYGEISVTVTAGTLTRQIVIESYFEIADKAAFDAAFKRNTAEEADAAALAAKQARWYKLTADIDYLGETTSPNSIWNSTWRFTGVFDGNGHSIYNLTLGANAQSANDRCLFGALNGGTIRNLALYNVTAEQRAGTIAGHMAGSSVIENCFVEVNYNGANMSALTLPNNVNNPAGLVAGKATGSSVVRNCVAVVNFTAAPTQTNIGMIASKTEGSGLVENSYALVNASGMSALSPAEANGSTHNEAGCAVYTDLATMLAEADFGDFGDVWTTGAGLVPHIGGFDETLTVTNTVTTLYGGNSAEVTVSSNLFGDNADTFYTLSAPALPAGVTFTDGVLAVDESFADEETEITVTVTSVLGNTAEKTFTVAPKPAGVYAVTVTGPDSDLFVGNAYDLTIEVTLDDAPYTPEAGELVVSVSPAAAASFDAETGKLTINDSVAFTVTATIAGQSGDCELEAWYEIADKGDFDAIFRYDADESQTDLTAKMSKWYKLTDNIDYLGQTANPNNIYNSAWRFSGILDGDGYSLYNVTTGASSKGSTNDLSVLGYLNGGTVRNMGFVNVSATNRSAVIAGLYGASVVDNCFVEMKYDVSAMGAAVGNNPAGGIAAKVLQDSVVSNCVAVVTLSGTPTGDIGMIAGKTTLNSVVEDCYAYTNLEGQLAVSTAVDPNNRDVNTEKAVNCGVYTTVAAFNKGFVRDGFATAYWGFPENALPTLNGAPVAESSLAVSVSEVVAGESVQLDPGNTFPVEYSVSGADGATITRDGLLSVPDSVSVGTELAVTVRSVFDKTAPQEVTITVVAPPAYTITVTSESAVVFDKFVIGYTYDGTSQITASSDGGGSLSYESGDPDVATVDSTGLITPTGGGTTQITITSSDDAAPATVTVTVMAYTPIYTIADFNRIEQENTVNGITTGNYMLMNDIDAAEDTTEWLSLANYQQTRDTNGLKGFNGIFDGNGHTISNLTPVSKAGGSANNVAPFGTIMKGGIVRNLAFTGLTLNNTIAGGIANMNFGTIENCYVEATFTAFHGSAGNASGGIVGKTAVPSSIA